MGKLACLGILVGDFVSRPVVKMPERGKLVLVDTCELHIGGCASNTAVVANKLGSEVSVIGKIGDDALGEFVLNALKKSGIDVSMVKIENGVTTSGTAVLVFPDGERSFLHSIGANSKFSVDDVDFDFLQNFSIVHVAGIFLLPGLEGENLKTLAKKTKETGRILSFDTAWDSTGRWLPVIKDALPFVDYFFTSLEEARMLSGENDYRDIAKVFLELGVKNVCLKMGPEGSYVTDGKQNQFFPALKVDAVDSTGAGDAYVAGFLTGLLNGYDLLKAGLLANTVGAMSVTAIGATSGIIDWNSLIAFAREHNVEI
ncbi:MAG: sugar kinase [Candidatus Omnitrophica bacterium]|nr:sugar kinase [Candidatus Omnitrophota bacterium]MCM8789197.1 sugar kinase [Candidatus Omnitrophota bacterium]